MNTDQTIPTAAFAAGRLAVRDLDAGVAAFQQQLLAGWISQGMTKSEARTLAAQAGQIMRDAVAKIPKPKEVVRLILQHGPAEAAQRYAAALEAFQDTMAALPQTVFCRPGDTGAN